MTLSAVKKSLITLLKTAYPDTEMHYYSMQVVEGYERPCFFTQIRPLEFAPANKNTRKTQAVFYITYMQRVVDEGQIYRVIDTVRDLFGLSVKIGSRAVEVDGMEYEFTGTERNVLEMSFTLTWYDRIRGTETGDIMETITVNQEIEMED